MARKRVTSITLSSEQEAELARRTSDDNRSGAIEKSMERLWAIYKEARANMKPLFTPEEQGFLLDTFSKTSFADTGSIRAIHLEVEDAIRLEPERLTQWSLPTDTDLANRVQKLTFAQKTALVDAVETWCNNQNGQDKRVFL